MSERAILVTTAKGVFFGYATETGGTTIKLRAAKLCVYWSADIRGFMGLASHGPNSKIGDIELYDITSVSEVTPQAAESIGAGDHLRGCLHPFTCLLGAAPIRKFETDAKRAREQVAAIRMEMKLTHPQEVYAENADLCADCALRVLASWPELLPDTSQVFAEHFGPEVVQPLDNAEVAP